MLFIHLYARSFKNRLYFIAIHIRNLEQKVMDGHVFSRCTSSNLLRQDQLNFPNPPKKSRKNDDLFSYFLLQWRSGTNENF